MSGRIAPQPSMVSIPRMTQNFAPIIAVGAILITANRTTLLVAAEPPINAKPVAAFEPLDKAILNFMALVDAQAATVAVAKRGVLLYSQGYGFSDKAHQTPCPPDALLRIASVTKAFTNTAIKNAVRAGKLSLDSKAFQVMGIKTLGGKPADPRILEITVDQLLRHQGGWDRSQSFDPMFRAGQIERELRLKRPAAADDVITFMLTQPLQFAPGEKAVYSNF